MLLHGAGSNGKSKLVDLAVRIVGNEAVMADRIDEIEGNVFKIGDLFAKLMLIDDDVAAGIALPDGLLKKLSERKLMRGQYKHKNPFGFISTALPILLSNSWPRSRDLSLGMRSRAEIITFERIFKKPSECAPDDPDRQRPDLWERVYAEEMSGVLNRLIAGYYRVRARGAFAPPRSCQEARDIWVGEANTLARFVREQCEDAPGHRTDLTNLFVSYRMWAWRENIPSNRMASRYSLKSSLQDLGYHIIRSNSASSIVEDLRLKPQEGLPVV